MILSIVLDATILVLDFSLDIVDGVGCWILALTLSIVLDTAILVLDLSLDIVDGVRDCNSFCGSWP